MGSVRSWSACVLGGRCCLGRARRRGSEFWLPGVTFNFVVFLREVLAQGESG